MPRQPFSPSLQHQALDLLAAGQPVKDVAAQLHLSRSTVYRWRRAHSPAAVHQPAGRQSELNAARTRIAELENELLAHRRMTRQLSDVVPPKGRFEAIRVMASEGHHVRSTAALLRVSESGYYAWCRRAPSGRMLRHARLTALILSIYQSSKAMYGSRRIHHELQECYDISVSRGTVELLMRQAGIRGRAGRTRWAAGQTLDSRMAKRLWVTDARAHHTETGTLYCAVVLDTNQRRLMGWSVDRAATRELVHRALHSALIRDAEELPPVRPQHARLTVYAFTERMQALALAPVTAQVPDRHAQAWVDLFWRKVGHGLLPRQEWIPLEILQKRMKSLFADFST